MALSEALPGKRQRSTAAPLNPCALRLDLEDGFDALRPKFGIAHTAEPAGRVYLNSARSFKSGDFDGHSHS